MIDWPRLVVTGLTTSVGIGLTIWLMQRAAGGAGGLQGLTRRQRRDVQRAIRHGTAVHDCSLAMAAAAEARYRGRLLAIIVGRWYRLLSAVAASALGAAAIFLAPHTAWFLVPLAVALIAGSIALPALVLRRRDRTLRAERVNRGLLVAGER